MRRNSTLIYCCDPVIGDAERCVFVERGLPELFRDRLCPMANILTPNQFELEWLGGTKLETVDRLVAAARTLANPSSSTVVVTGASLDDVQDDRIVTFAIEGKSVWSIATPKLQGSTSGAGDLFAALFVSSLIGGDPTPRFAAPAGFFRLLSRLATPFRPAAACSDSVYPVLSLFDSL